MLTRGNRHRDCDLPLNTAELAVNFESSPSIHSHLLLGVLLETKATLNLALPFSKLFAEEEFTWDGSRDAQTLPAYLQYEEEDAYYPRALT